MKKTNKSCMFAIRFRTLLEESGISQRAFADMMRERYGIEKTAQAISLYATGASAPDFTTLISIADFFQVSTDWMLGVSDVRTCSLEAQDIKAQTGLTEKTIERLREIRQRIETAEKEKPVFGEEADFYFSFLELFITYEFSVEIAIEFLVWKKQCRRLADHSLPLKKENGLFTNIDALTEMDVYLADVSRYRFSKRIESFVDDLERLLTEAAQEEAREGAHGEH